MQDHEADRRLERKLARLDTDLRLSQGRVEELQERVELLQESLTTANRERHEQQTENLRLCEELGNINHNVVEEESEWESEVESGAQQVESEAASVEESEEKESIASSGKRKLRPTWSARFVHPACA